MYSIDNNNLCPRFVWSMTCRSSHGVQSPTCRWWVVSHQRSNKVSASQTGQPTHITAIITSKHTTSNISSEIGCTGNHMHHPNTNIGPRHNSIAHARSCAHSTLCSRSEVLQQRVLFECWTAHENRVWQCNSTQHQQACHTLSHHVTI